MCFDKYEPLMIGSHVQAMPMGTAGRGMDDRGREHETDLSAESDKAPPYPWLSSTHGDP
jgi:hypothetical protein